MSGSLRLTILTPVETLLEAEDVAWVQAHLADGGPIGIYPGHAPLLAETVAAPLRYAGSAGEQAIDLATGILQVDRGGVTVLTGGKAQAGDAGGEAGRSAGGDTRFDQLALRLLAALQAQPGAVLDTED